MKKGPFGKFAVDVDNGFEPYYVVDADKKKKVAELKRLLKDADELFLATDEDREGEAIAWHLLQELKPKVPVKRMVFHEITREAIQRALANTRELDDRLVDAQETRRILDRLYGYEVSPVLWRKVRPGLSAGRVQSVATRLVVERERERMAFVAADYWDVTGTFAVAGRRREPRVHARGSPRSTARAWPPVATSPTPGSCGPPTSSHLDEAARDVAGRRPGRRRRSPSRSLETKPYTRRPAAPFTTSTLQQEASRKLRMASRQTMRTAQGLYENGYITYMRTDSSSLSSQAIDAARRQASELYGAEYVPDRPRVYTSKAKGAQEAHEAIRPAGDHFRTPGAGGRASCRGDQFRLYELIWKRTVASQMADARGQTASVRLGATARRRHATPVLRVRHRHHVPRLPRRVRGGSRRLAVRRGRATRRREGRRAGCRRWPRATPISARRPRRPTGTAPRRRRATPRRRWSRRSRSAGSAARRRTPRRSP